MYERACVYPGCVRVCAYECICACDACMSGGDVHVRIQDVCTYECICVCDACMSVHVLTAVPHAQEWKQDRQLTIPTVASTKMMPQKPKKAKRGIARSKRSESIGNARSIDRR